MILAFGCDHGGYVVKQEVIGFLEKSGHELLDFGCFDGDAVDYPDVAIPVCDAVRKQEADFGILICGTGIGMSMAANKMQGIRCAVLGDTFSAHATREHNDANVMALGARSIGPSLMLDIIDIFLKTPFSGDARHQRRIDKVMRIEQE